MAGAHDTEASRITAAPASGKEVSLTPGVCSRETAVSTFYQLWPLVATFRRESVLRKISIVLIAALTVGAIAMAQDYSVAPTRGPNQTDTYDKNSGTDGNQAKVTQTVSVTLPQATALHLDVTDLTFDLTAMDGATWPDSTFDYGGQMVCVYGSSETDQSAGTAFFGQDQTLPLGTQYDVLTYPNIVITNHGGAVTAYPPIQFDEATGQLVPGAKGHFVCYRTFELQQFSNGTQWDLSVERTDDIADNGIGDLFIQADPCDTWGQGTGLYALPQGETLRLVPTGLAGGPTGAQAALAPAACGITSWLKDVIVIAVEIDGQVSGTSAATLNYTMTTSAWPTATP